LKWNRLDGKPDIRLSMNFEDSVGFCPDLGRDTLVTHTVTTGGFPNGSGLRVRHF
jgi:hypothetical protein